MSVLTFPSALPHLHRLRRRTVFGALAGLVLCVLVALAAYGLLLQEQLAQQRQANAQRLSAYALSLDNLLARHETLPYVLSLDGRLANLLARPTDAALTAEVNRYLEGVQRRAGVAAVFLLDRHGQTLAASNWHTPQSFVGQSYAFRPYFRDAAEGRPGRFYGIGNTTRTPGFFLSAPLPGPSGPAGVVVVKVSLDGIERTWRASGDHLALADRDGVLFIATEPAWQYRTLAPLPPEVRRRLQDNRQYGDQRLPPLADGVAIHAGGERLRLPLGRQRADLLAQSHPAGSLGWRVLLFSELTEARQAAAGGAAAIGFAMAFVLVLAVYGQQRRRRLAERRAAQAELRRVEAELETRIAERTAALQAANTALANRVDALKRTESILRETRDSAVQAGKLAVLGQMAAGVTHELNQPLAALNTLSDNAVKLIELTRYDEARDNLSLIGQLTGRLGRIIGQLKSFARQAPAETAAVSVAQAVEHACLIVEPRRRELEAVIAADIDPTLQVQADVVRLEQVLVNLLRNGLDAMAGQPAPRLDLNATRHGTRLRLTVRDHGPGLPAEALERLFEPFYTTKPAGQGLGLGLAISLAIVESFGGTLTAGNANGPGAVFRLDLPVPPLSGDLPR
ncbi:ATP-binding protein [Pseudogulbenkiania sp. MAI-1]|uniref:sensor histidine kinase n=1 Tax=Pseudogulbenkiania sp. MAI-1 TaxID=990370 RepID=UPI00045E7510|nr:ATP-binding protein [Pseudogulbenkiania sp. MAI-1]